MSSRECPVKKGLPREVSKWLQTLQLDDCPRNLRRDLSSGYVVAEILSHYYWQDFPLRSYDKGSSLYIKQRNWRLIEQFLLKQHLHLMKELIDGTIHCKPGAAELLVQELHAILTNCSTTRIQGPDLDFSDHRYQDQLPTVARATASQAIRANLRQTEILAEPDISATQRKTAEILRRHLDHKAAERLLDPGRFKVRSRPSRATIKPSVPPSQESLPPAGASVSFKEITVHQPARGSLVHL